MVAFVKYSKYDGLNSMDYDVLSREDLPLYTNITVRIPGPTTVMRAGMFLRDKELQFTKNMFNVFVWTL